MRKTLFFLIILVAAKPVFSQNEHDNVYLFAYFINNGADGLHYAYSKDGYSWEALKGKDSSFLKPLISKDKLMRDPNIIKGADGLFHMVWTVSWNAKGIGYASSKDLVHWSEQQYLPVMETEDSARNCWAPEITYDAKTRQYMIYWATTIAGKFITDSKVENGYEHRIYYVTTKDFVKFSKTQILYDKGFNVIDATIVPDGKRFVMFLKDETARPVPQKNLHTAVSETLTGGYSAPSASITGPYWAEGPSALHTRDGWVVYFDKYRDHQYGAVFSKDLVNWTDISDKIHFPKGTRHGSALVITQKEFEAYFSR